MFFSPDQSIKSTFTQNKSCRSSLPLQLLFWPNFKFLYEKLRSGWSNLGQNSFEASMFLFLFSPVHAHTKTGEVPATPRVSRCSDPRPTCVPLLSLPRAVPIHSPLFSYLKLELSRARVAPPLSAPAPATPRHPASICCTPTSLASPRSSSTHPRARLSHSQSKSGLPVAATITEPAELRPSLSIPVLRSTSARFESVVSFPTR